MSERSQKKRYQDMNAKELAEATRQYDRPGTINRTRPMTRAECARDVKGRRGRPKIDKGSDRINFTVERELLARADAIARKEKIGRSELIARALASEIGRAMAK
jgi:post-segregation antitoxin (ccd killing protein)